MGFNSGFKGLIYKHINLPNNNYKQKSSFQILG